MAKIATKHLDVGTASGTVAAGNHTHAGGAGVLLQVKAIRDTTVLQGAGTVSTKLTPPTSLEGFAYPQLTLTFTPLAANSLLEVEVLVNAALNGTSNSGWVMLFDSGSATPTVAVALGGAALSYQTRMLPIKHFVVAGSVTQRTFTVRMSSANTTTFLNNSLSYSTPYFAPAVASSISVKEYAQ